MLNKNKTPICHFLDIPEELIYIIFGLLDLRILLILRRVCKEFFTVIMGKINVRCPCTVCIVTLSKYIRSFEIFEKKTAVIKNLCVCEMPFESSDIENDIESNIESNIESDIEFDYVVSNDFNNVIDNVNKNNNEKNIVNWWGEDETVNGIKIAEGNTVDCWEQLDENSIIVIKLEKNQNYELTAMPDDILLEIISYIEVKTLFPLRFTSVKLCNLINKYVRLECRLADKCLFTMKKFILHKKKYKYYCKCKKCCGLPLHHLGYCTKCNRTANAAILATIGPDLTEIDRACNNEYNDYFTASEIYDYINDPSWNFKYKIVIACREKNSYEMDESEKAIKLINIRKNIMNT